jgi:hypothetical protein
MAFLQLEYVMSCSSTTPSGLLLSFALTFLIQEKFELADKLAFFNENQA